MEQKDKSLSESRGLAPEQVLSILLLSHVSKLKVFHFFRATLKLVLNFRPKAQTQSQRSSPSVRSVSRYCRGPQTPLPPAAPARAGLRPGACAGTAAGAGPGPRALVTRPVLAVVLSHQLVVTAPLEHKSSRVWKTYLSMQPHHLAD